MKLYKIVTKKASKDNQKDNKLDAAILNFGNINISLYPA